MILCSDLAGLDEVLKELFGLLLILLIIWVGGLLLQYLLKAAAIYRMAKNAGMQSPGLAWVPVANNYLLGQLCDRAVYARTGRQWKLAVVLPVLDVISGFGSSFTSTLYGIATSWLFYGSDYSYWLDKDIKVSINGLLGLLCTAVTAVALYYLFCDYDPGREVICTVLSVIFGGIAQAILLMVIRNRVPVSVQAGYPPPGQPMYPGGYPGGPGQPGAPQGPYDGQGPSGPQGPYSSQGPGGPGTQWGQPPYQTGQPQPWQAGQPGQSAWNQGTPPGQSGQWPQPPGGSPVQGPWNPTENQPPASSGGPYAPQPGQAPYSGQESPGWRENTSPKSHRDQGNNGPELR